MAAGESGSRFRRLAGEESRCLPGGWVFEFRNDFYPDVDDTAFVLMALQRVDYPDRAAMYAAARRGIDWLLSMQNRDGGWGAFDHNNDRHVPDADSLRRSQRHDRSVFGGRDGARAGVPRAEWLVLAHPAVKRAVDYLAQEQTAEGAWYGRWGVNYVYGTSGVLRALETIALSAREYCQRAVAWLRAVQNEDGGFGESIASYYDAKLKGQGCQHSVSDGLGADRILAAPRNDDPGCRRSRGSTAANSRMPTGPGTKSSLPAPGSRACSI